MWIFFDGIYSVDYNERLNYECFGIYKVNIMLMIWESVVKYDGLVNKIK